MYCTPLPVSVRLAELEVYTVKLTAAGAALSKVAYFTGITATMLSLTLMVKLRLPLLVVITKFLTPSPKLLRYVEVNTKLLPLF